MNRNLEEMRGEIKWISGREGAPSKRTSKYKGPKNGEEVTVATGDGARVI